MSDFQQSQDAAFRRIVRAAIRAKKSGLTKSQRDVTLALVNLWFHHRNGPDGTIRPGRDKLAKRADVSVRTVASTLQLLRDGGAISPVAYANGGTKATRYTVDFVALMELCGVDFPVHLKGELAAAKACNFARFLTAKTGLQTVQKLHTVYNHVQSLPGQDRKDEIGCADIIPFRGVA